MHTRVPPPCRQHVCAPLPPAPRPPPPSPATPCPCPHPRVLPFWYFAVTFIKDKGEKSSRFVPYGQIQLVLGHFWGGGHTHMVSPVSPVSPLCHPALLPPGADGFFSANQCFPPVWCLVGVCGAGWGGTACACTRVRTHTRAHMRVCSHVAVFGVWWLWVLGGGWVWVLGGLVGGVGGVCACWCVHVCACVTLHTRALTGCCREGSAELQALELGGVGGCGCARVGGWVRRGYGGWVRACKRVFCTGCVCTGVQMCACTDTPVRGVRMC